MTTNRPTGASCLLALALLGTASSMTITTAQAQQQAAERQISFDVPARPVPQMLNDIARAAGLSVVFRENSPITARGEAIRGTMTVDQALAQLLAGTGLSWQFTNANTVTITDRVSEAHAPVDADGAVVLGTIDVTGGGESSVYSPYETAAPTNHIAAENIERFRGSSPADIFRGTPGVLSGEARNGAGSVDVNIRGMQGFGRVATTIDGAENAVTVYQGYQGVSNRTFVDPDFIAGVDIVKGADAGSWGNAGSVAMRTVGADDIVKPGDTWGLRVKGGFGTNTSNPNAGDVSGYRYQSGAGTATPSPTGMDRPSFLSPTSGSGSVVGAFKQDDFDFVAGYAHRRQGNYHAGRNGPAAEPLNIGDTPDPWGGTQPNTVINNGLVNYRGGEEVLNTQLETQSWLAKATARFADDHTLQIGYMGYRSEAGDRLASRLTSRTGQAVQQAQTVSTSLDTYTARYRWNPADSDAIDLKANLYWTHLELRNPIRGGRAVLPQDIGLPADFRVGSDTDMWGADVTNLSTFGFDHGDLDLTYGLSYRGEDTRGSRHTPALEGWLTPRDAIRHEAAGFVKAKYQPLAWDWLTFNAGLRYSHFWSQDRFDPYERNQIRDRPVRLRKEAGGFSPSVGVTLEPFDGMQLYVNYSNAMRAPSVIESVTAFNSVVASADVKPERSSNWEIGANFNHDGLLAQDDRAMLKLGYFNWNVKDYLARNVIVAPGVPLTLNIDNIDRARFSGIELSGRYEIGGFTADLAANYFLNVEYCRTADTCGNKSLYGDYATNHVQPKYTIDLTLSQKLLEERLTVGGRVSHVGPRAAGHGDVTAQGASQFIAVVDWKPYTLVDVFAEYKINDNFTASFRVENLFDRFYVDPLGLVTQPGPGRTFYASLTGSFGGDHPLPQLSSPFTRGVAGTGAVDWTGFYAGAHAGGVFGRTWGATTTLDGSDSAVAARESADQNLNGALFGVQAGYNWQLDNRFVLGIEADWSKTYMRDFRKVLSTDPVLAVDGHADAYTSYDIDWTSSFRGRIGYAVNDRMLAYATGGLALARETQWRDQYVSNSASAGQPLGNETAVMFVEKASATRAGFTIGGGVEYALNDRWSIRGDYGYTHFRRKDFKFANARAGTGKDYTTTTSTIIGYETIDYSQDPDMIWICDFVPEICVPFESPIYHHEHTNHAGGSGIVNGRNASNALDFHTFKIGLSYRF